jgi:hypothetical protein
MKKVVIIGGGLPPSAQTGKWTVQLICKKEKMKFISNKVQRIIKDNGHIAISDIRTSFMGLFLTSFRVTYSYK